MYKDKRILGIITARGGSKGIPGKNIRIVAGKPLIAYSVLAAKESKYLSRCIVSTDDDDISRIAKEYGGDVPFVRPPELATDTSTSMSVIQHALRWAKDIAGEDYDYVMILQPTSPLRIAEDIDGCITKIVDTDSDSVMSMMELSDFSLKKLKRIENDRIYSFVEDEGVASSRRQDLDAVYKRNCAIYLTKASLIEQGNLFGSVSRPYVMPADRSIDINEFSDLALAEFFLTCVIE